LKQLPPLKFRQIVLELALIAVIAIYGMREYINFDENMTFNGNEAQWLTSSAQYVAESWKNLGYVPLWQPYLSRGEPTIDSPFSFALNPFQTLPSVLFGYPNGVKVSIILSAIIAGWGGWYLGRVLGFGTAGRLLLGLLFAVKGPQHAAITRGYIQLGMTQAYLPWVVASAIAVIKFRHQRYPIVMVAFWITILFLGGNIYYTLPALVMAVLIMSAYLMRRRTPDDPPHWIPFVFDKVVWQRLLLSLAFTVGLAAVTFLPIFLNSGYIGRHATEQGWGAFAPLTAVLAQLFSPQSVFDTGVWNENYYIYTMPIWFAFIVFILLPVLERALPGERRALGENWRIWVIGIFAFVFFTTWGSGINAIIGWMYENLPLIGRWRNVNRMLTVTSFWTAVFAALWVDLLWKRIDPESHYKRLSTGVFRDWARAAVSVAIGGVVILLSLIAVWETVSGRLLYGSVVPESQMLKSCISWIQEYDDDQMVAAWTLDYFTVNSFVREGVRMTNINADYDPLGVAPTIFDGDLSEAMPEWIIPYFEGEQQYWGERGWQPIEGSPTMGDGQSCAWRNPNTLGYVFTIPYNDLLFASTAPAPEDVRLPLDPSLTQTVTEYDWQPGKISMSINNPTDERVVLVVQDVAWPGWVVRVDDSPARLESVGQLIGYVLPPNSSQNVEFEFTAPTLRFGAVVSVLTLIAMLLFLFRADRLLNRLPPLPPALQRFVPKPPPASVDPPLLTNNGAHQEADEENITEQN